MSYDAPSGSAIDFNFTESGYVEPSGSEVDFTFSAEATGASAAEYYETITDGIVVTDDQLGDMQVDPVEDDAAIADAPLGDLVVDPVEDDAAIADDQLGDLVVDPVEDDIAVADGIVVDLAAILEDDMAVADALLGDISGIISDTIYIGNFRVRLRTDVYDTGYGSPTIYYKQGATAADCNADTWHEYTGPFFCSGYYKIKVEN